MDSKIPECIEPAFTGAGRKPGLESWRIEDMKPVKQAETNGKFYTGDSYIVLHSIANESGRVNKWNIHFWLGRESTLDESGVAAYKSIELDDYLGGAPVQYREVQGEESSTFMHIFKDSGGVEYLPGGVESGFTKVERDVWPTRLLHLKGRKTVRVEQVPLELKSLNKGDVFILDMGLKLFVFNGPTSNRFEKAKGLETVLHINNDTRGARAEVVLVHEDPQCPEFWAQFGGFVDPESLPEGEDDAVVPEVKFTHKLFTISDETGSLVFEPVPLPDGKLRKEMLNGDDISLLHTRTKIYLWIGRKANLNEKREATAHAVKYIQRESLPFGFPIERVSEGCEPGSFKSEFYLWDPPSQFKQMSKGVAGKIEEQPADVQALLARKAQEDIPVDDGSGDLTIWVVQDFKKVEVDKAHYGHFFGGDSYILLYSYKKNNRDEHIIYFWLGNGSTVDERGAAALLAMQLDDSMGGRPVQVRVTQGKEPAHFRQLFKGKTVIYRGGRERGDGGAGAELDDVCLLHIRGTNALNTVSVQVTAEAAALNSTDTFVLVTQDKAIAWLGKGANEDELVTAESICKMMADSYNGRGGRTTETLHEGSETEEFWAILGGKGPYAEVGPGEQAPRDPRLFSCSTATGSFKVEEVDQFDQTDLNDEDVFLLDTFTTLFVWIGSQSTDQEKEKAVEFAGRFIAEAEDGRDPDMPVIRVSAGDEPTMFSCHFHAWDDEFTKKQMYRDPYQQRLEAIEAEKKKRLEQEAAATAAEEDGEDGAALLSRWSSKTGASMKSPSQKYSPPPKSATTPVAKVDPTEAIDSGAVSPLNAWSHATGASMGSAKLAPTATKSPSSSSKEPVKKWSISSPEPPPRNPGAAAPAVPVGFTAPPPAVDSVDTIAHTIQTLKVDKFYSVEELQGPQLPADVEAPLREQYLSEADFKAHFGMEKAEFNELKKWKRDDIKKKKNMF